MDFRPLSGIAIDRDFANIFEELRTPIMDHGQVKELRVVIDKIDIVVAAYKGGFAQDVGQKANVCLDAEDTEFIEFAEHLLYSLGVGETVCRCFHEQGIVVRRNNGPGKGVAAVKADPKPAAAAVGNDLPESGMKPFRGSSVVTRHWMALRGT